MNKVRSAAKTVFQSGGDPRPDTITVAISLFNYERYIVDCLQSVHAQTHENIDLILVDDQSDSDYSLEAATSWIAAHADRFGRALVLEHRYNQGLAEARNTAFAVAQTEFVFSLDADNFIFPSALAKLYKVARNRPCGAVYSQLQKFGSKSEIGEADFWSRENFLHGNYIDAMALIRKQTWEDVGGYVHIENGWEDYDFWCRCIERGVEAIFLPEILCAYRVHKDSMLRANDRSVYREIFNVMTLRHPWLDLKGLD